MRKSRSVAGNVLPSVRRLPARPLQAGKSCHNAAEHVTANMVLSLMTIVASFTLAALLYSILAFQPNTHPLIYVTASLLLAMGIWHIQTFWRTLMLRKHFKKNSDRREREIESGIASTDKLLEQPDFENMVPASVTDRTTKHLSETNPRELL